MSKGPLGPYNVYRLHPNSLKEEESLTVRWALGRLTVTYARSERPDSDEFYIEEWVAECPKPLVTSRCHRSANLQQYLEDLERGNS